MSLLWWTKHLMASSLVLAFRGKERLFMRRRGYWSRDPLDITGRQWGAGWTRLMGKERERKLNSVGPCASGSKIDSSRNIMEGGRVIVCSWTEGSKLRDECRDGGGGTTIVAKVTPVQLNHMACSVQQVIHHVWVFKGLHTQKWECGKAQGNNASLQAPPINTPLFSSPISLEIPPWAKNFACHTVKQTAIHPIPKSRKWKRIRTLCILVASHYFTLFLSFCARNVVVRSAITW